MGTCWRHAIPIICAQCSFSINYSLLQNLCLVSLCPRTGSRNSSEYGLFDAGMALSVPLSSAFWLLLLPCYVLSVSLNTTRPYISDDQAERAGITRQIADAMETAWNFERSTWATGPVQMDPFYQAPPAGFSATPGSLLKVEEATDTTKFTIPPGTALSRILFQSRALNGAAIPASAFVLWPYSPRRLNGGRIPVVA